VSDGQVLEALAAYTHDPLGYVLFSFPWGQPGTVLADRDGPEPWQRTVLEEIGKGVEASDDVIREAVASGHGVGKSALVAWILLWGLFTCDDARVAVTANTEPQLRTKTWPEVLKWFRMAAGREAFVGTATTIHSADPDHKETWRADALTWSENNTEAFAGLHNVGKRIVLIFDEASAIADKVWEVAEGALTDAVTEIVWAVFGNPTRNTGRFKECFGSLRHRWNGQQVDSRTVSFTNKTQIDQWVKDYGEDSDFVRVRVRGEFPRAGSMQFIDSERVALAIGREVEPDATAPLIMGVDIARHGDAQSVIRFRRGLDAYSIPAEKFQIADLMQVAAHILALNREHKPDAIFLDATGMGYGVYDRLLQLGCQNVVAVNFGGKPDRLGEYTDANAKYANKRAEMWGFLKDWCRFGSLPDDRELKGDLTAVEYGYDRSDAILLERKDDMRKRGIASPDDGDALALTFAYPVASNDPVEEYETPVPDHWMAA
jgi:hypothetical protein